VIIVSIPCSPCGFKTLRSSNAPCSHRLSYIHWVAECPSENSPIRATVRLFNPLFTADNPDSHPDGYLSVLNPKSEDIYPNAMIENGFNEVRRRAPWPKSDGETDQKEDGTASPETVRFQGMRVAYFCMDKEAEEGNLVFNRIVSLKEDPKKG
jgi:glutaminyl-tRNA synthetase